MTPVTETTFPTAMQPQRPVWERNASGELQFCFPLALDGPGSWRSPCGPAAAKVAASRDGGRPTSA
jgi:hypothetical protein